MLQSKKINKQADIGSSGMQVARNAIGVLALSLSAQASAVVLDFDDIDNVVSDGYGGLQWDNFFVLDGADNSPSGYENGVISPPNVAYNGGGGNASTSDGEFSFCSAWLTGAWNEGLQVTVEGWFNGSMEYTRTVTLSYDTPTQVQFDFNGVDELRFSSTGGVDAGGDNGSGTHFALDDMEIEFAPQQCSGGGGDDEPPVGSPAPIPTMSAYGLVMTVLGLLVVAGRRLRVSSKRH